MKTIGKKILYKFQKEEKIKKNKKRFN